MSDPALPCKAARLAALLAERLSVIRTTNGYFTDAGQYVWHGRTALDPDRLPCITIFEDEDQVEQQRVSNVQEPDSVDVAILLPFNIESTSPCDPDHPHRTGHQLAADIKRAIFSADHTWGDLAQMTQYVGRTLTQRGDGGNLVTATVRIRIGITENLAAP